MFPIIPAVNCESLLRDAAALEEASPQRYSLILALCAVTRLHLQLDVESNNLEGGPGEGIPTEPRLTGQTLLEMAEASLRNFKMIHLDDLDPVITSYFLFCGYAGLGEIAQGSFFLDQSINMGKLLGLTRESAYKNLSEEEKDWRRRAFWLLFVTERFGTIQFALSLPSLILYFPGLSHYSIVDQYYCGEVLQSHKYWEPMILW